MDTRRYVLLEPDRSRRQRFSKLDAWVCRTTKDIVGVVPLVSKSSVWISFGPKADDDFLKAVIGRDVPRGHWLALKPPRLESIPLLSSFFQRMIGVGPAFHFLPDEELADVLNSTPEEGRNLLIGGAVDVHSMAVSLIRGDLSTVTVPLAIFRPNRVTRPVPSRLRFTDYGQTVCLGAYEASADSILYEIDPRYRAKANARRREEEKTFGASLRRLRRQMMLRRADFSPVSAKEIARIECGEIVRPQRRTMKVIASRLGVEREEIETW